MSYMTGMDRQTVRANGITLNLWVGGKGPAALLLHGWPQTAQIWHKVAPRLTDRYTVISPDHLRYKLLTVRRSALADMAV